MKKYAPIMSYWGSKRKEIKHIFEFLPDKYLKIVDVFGGIGTISLNHVIYYGDKIQTHYNEINKEVAIMLQIMKDENRTDEFIKTINEIRLLNCEEYFYKVRDYKIKLDTHIRNFYLNQTSMLTVSNLPKKKKDKNGIYQYCGKIKKVSHYNQYNELLKNTEITTLDYKIILERYKNDETSLLYLDPPYVGSKVNEYGYKFDLDDILYIYEFMNSCKCRIILNIDFCGWIYMQFKSNIRKVYSKNYDATHMTKQKNIYTKYHCIITNYTDFKKDIIKKEINI